MTAAEKERLRRRVLEEGVDRAAFVPVTESRFDLSFRDI